MTPEKALEELRLRSGFYDRKAGSPIWKDRSAWNPGAGARPMRPAAPQDPNRFDMMFGADPTPDHVMRFMKLHTPAAPLQRGGVAPVIAQPPAAAPVDAGAGSAGAGLVEQAFAQSAANKQRARDENLKRYDQVVGGKLGLHDRAMAEVPNWGEYQRKVNEEKAKEALDNQIGQLTASGIANSNVIPAFSQRNARDLGMAQQALSERVSDRKISFDTSLTNDLLAAVERRNDTAPDDTDLVRLAMEYERAGAERQQQQAAQAQAAARANELQRQPAQSAPRRGVQGGVAFAGPNPLQLAGGMLYGAWPQAQEVQQQQSQRKKPTQQQGQQQMQAAPVMQAPSNRYDANGLTAMQRRVVKKKWRDANGGIPNRGNAARVLAAGDGSLGQIQHENDLRRQARDRELQRRRLAMQ